jgi:glycosyltransferase involved in cell wall biosynthesis
LELATNPTTLPRVPKVSVTVITHNEAKHIRAALESVAWADERIVVDSGSTDGTPDLARGLADRVETRVWEGYGAQKNYAASLARHDWILSLDADERVSEGLRDEIRTLIASEPDLRGYRIPRVTFHLGRWIRTTDWYPDPQLRLYDRRAAAWRTSAVHESVEVRGGVGRLRGELQHFAYDSIADHLETINRYTTLAAGQMGAQGRRATWWQVAAHPPAAFLRNYIVRGGYRDGTAGLIVSLLNSYYTLLKFAKLWELQQKRPEGSAPDEAPR